MNNCPKCGNPLQIGTTSCPICGTNTSTSSAAQLTPAVESTQSPAVNPTPAPVAVEQIAAAEPVAPVKPAAPATEPAPVIQPEPQVAPVTVTPVEQPVAPLPNAEPAVQSPVTPITSTEVVEQAQPAQPVQVQAVAPTPVATPELKIEESAIAPTIKPIESSSPVPSIPASLTADAPVEVPKVEKVNTSKPKKSINKTVLAVVVLILIVGIVAVVLMNSGTKTNLNPAPATNNENTLATTSISSNGYKLKLEDGWLINEDGTNVIITNSNDTVAIKLNHTDTSLSSISKETIEGYFQSRTDFTNTTISETTISAKDAYLVNTSINEAPVQVYYIGGGTNLTIGATIVYQTEESKTKYEASVTEMIGSLSYSDESIKAISTMEMYSNIFNVYNGSIYYTPAPETPSVDDSNIQTNPTETPGVETPTTPSEEPVTE